MAKLMTTKTMNEPSATVNITEKDLPAIKGWKVGEKYTIEMEVELTRLSKGDIFMPQDKRTWEASFKVLSAESDDDGEMKPSGKTKVDEMKMERMKKKYEET